tara:strand:+ start:26484 stop:27956 length:1473 start_codon:yes stop_codon:yes gene_type:complete
MIKKVKSPLICNAILWFASIYSTNIYAAELEKVTPPNIIIIFADDMGYGDMSNNGHPTLKTPNLDKMAAEGQKWTNFYVAAPVCTPSRAGLMLGKYPVRAGLASSAPYRNVFREDSLGGIPDSELTIAEALKAQGYKTAMVGKWHLGHMPEALPTHHGFDSWFGVPYSNDMNQDWGLIKKLNGDDWSLANWSKGKQWTHPKPEYFKVPLMQDEKVLEYGPNQHELTKRYTDKATAFIKENKQQPFFLYLAHAMPHVPLFASEEFTGRSTQGLYGDVMEELDWSVGQVLQTLREQGIAENTLVVFSSDNGPWLLFETMGGSAGPFRGGKNETLEGGLRVPGFFWWPGHIKPELVHDIGSTIDLLPTLVSLAGGKAPENSDAYDLSDTLLQGKTGIRNEYFYYRGDQIYAVRKGQYKAHFLFKEAYGNPEVIEYQQPILYDLNADPGEKYDIAKDHPEVVTALQKMRAEQIASLKPVVNQLTRCKKGSRFCP